MLWRKLLRGGLYGKAFVVIGAFVPGLGACAPAGYGGISLQAGAADAGLQDLARRAQAGDKHAQLELGIRHEEGLGVPIDLKRARQLYRSAASKSDGVRWVYSAPAREGQAGRMIPVSSGSMEPGLEEARLRLVRLDHKR